MSCSVVEWHGLIPERIKVSWRLVTLLKLSKKRQGLYISSIEEIAYKKGFISKEQLLKLADPLMKTEYGKYLAAVAEGL